MARAVQANVSEVPAVKTKPATKAKPKPSAPGEQSPPPFEKQLKQLRRGEGQNKAEAPAAKPAQPVKAGEVVETPVEQAPSPAVTIPVADDGGDVEVPVLVTDEIIEVQSPADEEPLSPQVAAVAPPPAEQIVASATVEPEEPEPTPQPAAAPPAAVRIVRAVQQSLPSEEVDAPAETVREPDSPQPIAQAVTKPPMPAQPKPQTDPYSMVPRAEPMEPTAPSGAEVRAEQKSQAQSQVMLQPLEATMPPVDDAEAPAAATPVVASSTESAVPQPASVVDASIKPGTSPAPLKPAAAPPPPPPEANFAQANHGSIVSAVRGQLLPNGGSMQIRLDPPELGSLQITVRMVDGVMSASFQTSNEQATQLLSHSLNQLKHGLESQGVSVDKIQVQQSPRNQQASGEEQSRQQHEDDQSSRQEQQRKEMLRRMWRRLSIGGDPLDMVA